MRRIDFKLLVPAFYSLASILLAILLGGVILLFIGKNPWLYFSQLFYQGLNVELGLVESIIKMSPLLIVSAGLVVCFSAGLWNIGVGRPVPDRGDTGRLAGARSIRSTALCVLSAGYGPSWGSGGAWPGPFCRRF